LEVVVVVGFLTMLLSPAVLNELSCVCVCVCKSF